MNSIFQTYDSIANVPGVQSSQNLVYPKLWESLPENSDSLMIDSTPSALAHGIQTKPQQESMFVGHQLHVGNYKEETIKPANEDWIAIHLIGVLFILAWLRLGFAKRLKQLIASFATQRHQGMLSKEGNILREQISLGLLVIYLVSTSIFIYLMISRLLPPIETGLRGFQLFSIVLLGLLGYWLVKTIGITMIGHIFKNPVLLSEYILTNFIFNVVLAIGLIPFLLIIVYVPSQLSLYLSLALFTLAHIYRIIRQLLTALSYPKFSYVNRFLYLCTFEIAPILVLTKLVINRLA